MDYKVVLSARANRDLFELVSFIARKNPSAAEKTGSLLLDAAESLHHFPFRGPIMKHGAGLRKLSHPPHYLIVYQVNEPANLVEIIRFWDARQNPSKLDTP